VPPGAPPIPEPAALVDYESQAAEPSSAAAAAVEAQPDAAPEAPSNIPDSAVEALKADKAEIGE
jgi:hypothetical protein